MEPSGGILSPTDPKNVAIMYSVLGICFHLSIRTIEIDYRIWRLLGVYIVLWAALTGVYLNVHNLPLLQAIKLSSLAGSCFNADLTVSITVYRLFFRRLRRFPGPWGAKLSRFYNVWLAFESRQYYLEVEDMHRKNGDFVLTGRDPYQSGSSCELYLQLLFKDPERYPSIGPRRLSLSTDLTRSAANLRFTVRFPAIWLKYPFSRAGTPMTIVADGERGIEGSASKVWSWTPTHCDSTSCATFRA